VKELFITHLYSLLGHTIEQRIPRSENVTDLVIKANNGERWIARCEQKRGVDESLIKDFLNFVRIENPSQAAIITAGNVTQEAKTLVQGRAIYILDYIQFQDYLNKARLQVRKSNAVFHQVSSYRTSHDR
jgi:hypothetical protein